MGEISEDILDEVMNEENDSQNPPAMPELPDGIGLDYEQVSSLLLTKCKVVVEHDDPIMMLIPVLNCFLTEEANLLKRHNETLTRVLGDRADNYIKNVRLVSDDIRNTLSSVAVESIQKTFEKQKEVQEKSNSVIKWSIIIILLSAIMNVGALIAMVFLKGN